MAPNTSHRLAFRALAHRNFRLFFVGQGLSVIGTWLQQVALSWLTYRLTDSALLLGVVSFSQHIAVLFLAPAAGVLADRIDRRRAVRVTQTLQLLLAVLLAVATLAGTITIAQVLAITLAMGIVAAFDIPLRHALISQLVDDRGSLPNAIALNSTLINAARVIGPALAGLLIALVGEGWCFAINAASFLAVVIALSRMQWPHIPPESARSTGLWDSWLAGARYVAGYPPIRSGLALVAALSWTIGPYSTLMPVFARDIYTGGPAALGTLLASAGIGALAGTLFLASRPNTRGLDTVVVRTGILAALALLGFAGSRMFALALPLLALMGFGFIVSCASLNTLIQTVVEDDKRGRVMSLYTMAFIGISPLGNLTAGAVAGAWGAPVALALNGLVCLVAVGWFRRQLPRLREIARPAYARIGTDSAPIED